VHFLKSKIIREKLDTAIASESSLRKDWLLPEEDKAWQSLMTVILRPGCNDSISFRFFDEAIRCAMIFNVINSKIEIAWVMKQRKQSIAAPRKAVVPTGDERPMRKSKAIAIVVKKIKY
jgi:hypothetical protein